MFYKSPANTGTHIGNLWTSAGTLLGTVTFTNEGVSGWQQMNFATPVAITANTTYVASYHTSTGHYSDNAGYFTTAVNAPPLQALASSVASNGVYTYGATSAFPSSTFNSSNYWVDVMFLSSAESVSPTALTFAGQPIGVASASQPVNVTNTGTTAFSLTGITFSGTNPVDFAQTNNCGSQFGCRRQLHRERDLHARFDGRTKRQYDDRQQCNGRFANRGIERHRKRCVAQRITHGADLFQHGDRNFQPIAAGDGD